MRWKRSRIGSARATTSSRKKPLAVAALLCAIAYTLLGLAVSHRPPSPLDASYVVFLAHGAAIELAWIFTSSCLWYVLVPYAIAAGVLAVRSRAWRERALFSIVVTVVTWQTSNVLKDLFRRPRPEHWLRVHESSFSYSSGHAMFAVIVYGLWAYFVWNSALPLLTRRIVSAILVLWAIGVIWSRLALGAHYPTDLAGGVLLAVTTLSIAATIAPGAFARPGAARGVR